jgi:hypothetical protein
MHDGAHPRLQRGVSSNEADPPAKWASIEAAGILTANLPCDTLMLEPMQTLAVLGLDRELQSVAHLLARRGLRSVLSILKRAAVLGRTRAAFLTADLTLLRHCWLLLQGGSNRKRVQAQFEMCD